MALPALSVQVQGQGSVTADNLNTYTQTCTTAAVLRNFVGISGMNVFLDGITSVDDGHAGMFYWNATGTLPDDNLNTIVPHAAPPSGGEWQRFSSGTSSITLSGDVTGPTNANVIAPAAVTTSKIAPAAITTGLIANGAVATNSLANTAVTTTKIANGAVTNPLLASMANNTFKGNVSGSIAPPVDVPLATLQASLGIVPGSYAVQGYYGRIASTTLTQQFAFGGVTCVRNSAGVFTFTLGSAALTIGFGMISGSFPGSHTQRSWFWQTNGPMAAGGAYELDFHDSSNNYVDPNDVFVLFY